MMMRRHDLPALLSLGLILGCNGEEKETATNATAMTNVSTDPTGDASVSMTSPETDTGDTETAGETDTETGETSGGMQDVTAPVDILFVIDDTGTMGEEQAGLTASIAQLIDPLQASGISVRIGITTTDVGNPRCPKADTTPPNGQLQLDSCVDRVNLGDFVFNGVDPQLNVEYVCTDYCDLSDADISILPTATTDDPELKPRPWIEFDAETSNVDSVGITKMLQCALPQGIAGCGFEAPLEAMYKAITRADLPGEANYGFLREEARLVIIILTDEADCSADPGYNNIFTTNKVFWNNPDDPVPTSGVCWRAGVSCTGQGPIFDDCYADNHDSSGAAGASDSNAVLYPTSRYSDLLDDLKTQKGGGDSVQLHLIAGVPVGYDQGAPLVYSEDAGDDVDDLLYSYGILPGCKSADGGNAIPPVRARELAESLAGGVSSVHSICEPSYTETFTKIAASILEP